jgi:alpha-D-xyloside xylohydrolase
LCGAHKEEDLLEIRVYGGRDANSKLYEDSGNGYNYEPGAKTTIYFNWDDRRQTLSMGKRSGSIPGMILKRTFQRAFSCNF